MVKRWIVMKSKIDGFEDRFLESVGEWEDKGWTAHPESFNVNEGTYYILLSRNMTGEDLRNEMQYKLDHPNE